MESARLWVEAFRKAESALGPSSNGLTDQMKSSSHPRLLSVLTANFTMMVGCMDAPLPSTTNESHELSR